MAKRVHAVQLKGFYDTTTGRVTEIGKEETSVYDLGEILTEFHGKKVTISIKEDTDIPSLDIEQDIEDDEFDD